MNELRQCLKCGAPTRPGRWRCDTCQKFAAARPVLRLVTLPGRDADNAASRARHPSNLEYPPGEANEGS